MLVDEYGTEEELTFGSKREFELWAANNTLKLSLDDGSKQSIKTWERLQYGGRYYITRTLEKTVRVGSMLAVMH